MLKILNSLEKNLEYTKKELNEIEVEINREQKFNPVSKVKR